MEIFRPFPISYKNFMNMRLKILLRGKMKSSIMWLPVIQSRYLDPFSFMQSAEALHELIGDYPRVAIGTVCKCKNLGFIEFCCKYARKVFPHSWIHAFGMTLTALPRVMQYINSFDSMAWTFPRTPGKSSCKNEQERKEYFYAYLKRVNEVAGNVRFYTYPPNGCEYPYILCNRRNYQTLFTKKFEHAILDVGVMDFCNPHVKDYPPGFMERWKKLAEALTEALKGKIWIVIPDYPDDYNPGQFGCNITKTLENIKNFINIRG
ncbi:MAG: hypothetical protein QXL06_02000 [Nitrososphaerota archaeon]